MLFAAGPVIVTAAIPPLSFVTVLWPHADMRMAIHAHGCRECAKSSKFAQRCSIANSSKSMLVSAVIWLQKTLSGYTDVTL